MPTFIDLFCGAGLFSHGFKSIGFTPLLAVDADPLAVRTYNANVANVALNGSVEDVRTIKGVDVVIAGPPCQGFSTLGKRDPDDVRNRLCFAVAKWARATQAKIVVVENVPQFIRSDYWHGLAKALRRQQYELVTWTLDAANYKTPQRRVRSFTIASRIGLPGQPKPTGLLSANAVFPSISSHDPMHIWPTPTKIAASRIRCIPPAGDWRDVMRRSPKLCPPSWFKLGCQATDVWGRIDSSVPANTLKTRFQNPSTGRYLHPTKNRVISLREGARLQGVPDEWNFHGNREAIVRQIGNGVPVPLAEAIAREVAKVLGGRRRSPLLVA